MGGELVAAVSVAAPRPARTVLLIAYHFPPLRGSSGIQRTLRFAQHLPRYGWRPIVLSIHPRAYEETGATAGNEVPADLAVHRAFGLNTASELSLFGRYPAALALPDRWATWRFWAVPKALNIVRSEGVDAVWTTFPIATAHSIGLEIASRTGLPWIAEFRDPMWQSDWPPEPRANVAWRQLEREIFAAASHIVFTAPSAVPLYADRFPEFPPSRFVVIENGFDEDSFRRAEGALAAAPRTRVNGRPTTLLHSGIIYRQERDPTQLFAALGALKRKGVVSARDLRIVLRASGAEADFAGHLAAHDLGDIVFLEPAVDYTAALEEMLSVDGLLILQAANCNAQIPAKLYEYLRAQRPILALTDPDGDTARTLESAGVGLVARLDSAADIEAALSRFLTDIRAGTARIANSDTVARYSREAQAGVLAHVLDRATAVARSLHSR